jgi:predicted PurR-regulated permease PerM
MVMMSGVGRNALVIIAVIVTAYALNWMRGILTPLALAIFMVVMIDGFARLLALRAPFLPEWAALPVALLISTMAFGVTVYTVASNAASFAGQLLSETTRLNALLAGLASAFGVKVPPTVSQIIDQLNPTRYIGDLARALQTFASGAVYVFVYMGFLILSRQGFRRKVGSMFPDLEERDQAEAVFFRIRDGIERYLWIQTVTGLMIAVGSGLLMAALGLANPVFWAFLIFVLTFIPVIGGAVGTLLPPLFALVQFPDIWRAVALLCGLEIIMFSVGNVLTPRMQRDSLNIDPVVVLLSLALWGAIWGIPGMFLSTPLTVACIIILAQFEGSRWIAILLSGDGAPQGRSPSHRAALAPPSPAGASADDPQRPIAPNPITNV